MGITQYEHRSPYTDETLQYMWFLKSLKIINFARYIAKAIISMKKKILL